MKLVKKIVGSATENTLLQLDRVILICSITGLVLDVLAVFLVFQSDTKKWGVILLLVVLLILTLALLSPLGQHIVRITKLSKVKWLI